MIVLSAGFQTTVQDCGRPGFRKFGITAGGALDSMSLRLANLCVGNDESAAGLEIISGRVRLQFDDERLVAWGGGEFAVHAGEVLVPPLHCARAAAGTVCEIRPKHGRAWLAVSGGIDVPEVLRSRSTDVRAGFGGCQGRALRDNDELPLARPGPLTRRIASQIKDTVSDWSAPHLSTRSAVLRIIPGRQWKQFPEDARTRFSSGVFRVAMNSDRMGLRLEGDEIYADIGELPSEAIAPGAIQVPRGGAPIVLLADCQTVGGYPKIAHVITVDFVRAAQLQPQDEIRFQLFPLGEARELWLARERDIALFRSGLRSRFE